MQLLDKQELSVGELLLNIKEIWISTLQSYSNNGQTNDDGVVARLFRALLLESSNWSYSSDSCHGSESNLTKCNVRLINTKESNPANHFGKSILNQIMQKLDYFARLQSRHLNILFLGNLGKPNSCQRPRVHHHQSCLSS